MMLGTAASTSTNEVSGRRSRAGAYSVTNSAVQIDTGTAITSAITAMMTVPTNAAHTPKCPNSGCQTDRVKNPKPATRRALHARTERKIPIRTMSPNVSAPLARTTARKRRSEGLRRETGRTRGSSDRIDGSVTWTDTDVVHTTPLDMRL